MRQSFGKEPTKKECEYILPSKTMPCDKYQYVKALEARVAELEMLLTKGGLTDLGKDHWLKVQPNEVSENPISPAGARPDLTLPSPRIILNHGTVARSEEVPGCL